MQPWRIRQHVGEGKAGELAALFRVEYIRPAEARERLLSAAAQKPASMVFSYRHASTLRASQL